VHCVGEIVGVEVYRNDVVVKRRGLALPVEETPRQEVKEFSWESRRRLAFVASNTTVKFRTMVTLTYPRVYPTDGKEVKRHLNSFLVQFKREVGPVSYLWFLEFQARGAPHVHILLDYPFPRNPPARKWIRLVVSCMWYRIVDSGDYRHLAAGTRCEKIRKSDGAARYAVKYATKMRQKAVPPEYRNVGRFWAASRDVKPEPEAFIRATEDDIRGELEDWEFKPAADRPVYRVLYNQADRFRAHSCPTACRVSPEAQGKYDTT